MSASMTILAANKFVTILTDQQSAGVTRGLELMMKILKNVWVSEEDFIVSQD
jgi:hypothetical protein